MPLIQVIVLAIVQGLTEFLPISSTAHLYLTSWLLGWQAEELSFDIALHIGTLFAVLIYFFRDWLLIIADGLHLTYNANGQSERNRALLWLLAVGSIPVGIAGLIFHKQAESSWRNPFVIGGMMIGVGILMAVAERVSRRTRHLDGINLADSLAIGAAQAVALIPGTSRSGITLIVGLLRDIDREAAARFSFLLSTPAIAAAAIKTLHDLPKQGHIEPVVFILGIAVSAITGCAVIAWFLRYLNRHSLTFFVYYRVIFGIIVIALAFLRRAAE